MQQRIVLSTLNSRYTHASFGLRYLMANLGAWRGHARLREFTIHDRPLDVAEAILEGSPTVVGFGVYIWNVRETTDVVRALKALRPTLTIVIGGPEVSYEYEGTPIFALADHLIPGEADLAFPALIDALAAGERPPKVVTPALPEPSDMQMPYGEYTDEDLAHRLTYVEASRGCPFRCEFCLSSREIPVRAFPLEPFLAALDTLLARGAKGFKFVDRTFNLNVRNSSAILEFCLERYRPGFELHFEMIPDRLPDALRDIVCRFPPGAVQFEVGIQTFTPDVMERISRKQDLARTEANLRFLRENTAVHIHADLIFGLPGETLETFAASFDRLYAMRPGEIQLGVLKRLRGTPIGRHAGEFAMVFAEHPPYEVLETSTVGFADMQRMRRFARYLDLFYNSADFVESMPILLESACGTPFESFLAFGDWLYAATRQTHKFALARLYRYLFTYLVEHRGADPASLAQTMLRDYDRLTARKERLEFLRPWVPAGPLVPGVREKAI